MITATERAERTVGAAAVRKLEAAGLKIVECNIPRNWFNWQDKPVIGRVYHIDEERYYDVVGMDEADGGYEIVVWESIDHVWTEWVSKQNCKKLELI